MMKRLLTFTVPAVALVGSAYLLTSVFDRATTGETTIAMPDSPHAVEGREPAAKRSFGRAALCENVYEAVCKTQGTTRDPTGSVRSDIEGELEVLRIYETITRAHPDLSREEVDEKLVQEIYTPRRRARVESAYRWVQGSIRRFIQSQPQSVFTAKEKRMLIGKVAKTRLQLPPPATEYGDEPELFTKNDVYYERLGNGATRLRIGGAYLLTARSWFNLVFTLAHELAHAIDPCEIRSAALALPAYDRISACFVREGLVPTLNTRTECGQNDHLSETFADWLASQVAADALAHYATEFDGAQLLGAITNSVRDLCEQDDSPDEPDHGVHPPAKLRIDQIFGQNPRIRGLLGCSNRPEPRLISASDKSASSDSGYCSFNAIIPGPKGISP